MKKLITLLLLVATLGTMAQTTATTNIINFSFCLPPVAPTTVDSIQLTATLVATDGYGSIKWAQVSGPNTATITTVPAFLNTTIMTSQTFFKNLVAGTYIFSATGTSAGGVTHALTDTVVILPAPPIPVPKTVTFSLVNGVWTPVFSY